MDKIYSLAANFFSQFLKIVPNSLINAVGADKVEHFFAGFLISVIASISHVLFGTAIIYILVAPILIGILKELVDFILNQQLKRKELPPTHGVSLYDALATSLGGVPLFLIIYFGIIAMLSSLV